MKFYKYKSLNSMIDLQRLEGHLKQDIYLPTIDEFNDPFEGKFILKPFNPETVLSNPTLLEGYRKNHIATFGHEISNDDYIALLKGQEFNKNLEEDKFIPELFVNHAVFCMMATNQNVPMWAYYASDHSGYCLEFEFDISYIKSNAEFITDHQLEQYAERIKIGDDILSFRLNNTDLEFIFLKIQYNANMPTLELEKLIQLNSAYLEKEYIAKNSIGHKSDVWRHENEYRLICNNNGALNLLKTIPFIKISGIITGCKMNPFNKKIIKKLCKENNIQLSHIIESDNQYTFNVVSD